MEYENRKICMFSDVTRKMETEEGEWETEE